MKKSHKAGGRYPLRTLLLTFLAICSALAAGLFVASTSAAITMFSAGQSVEQRTGEQQSVEKRSGEQQSVEQRSGEQQSVEKRTGEQPGISTEGNQDPKAGTQDSEDGERDTGAGTGSFSVTFIDVGQGDSALVSCDGHFMLIDGGKGKQSDKIYAFLKGRGITFLEYIVATHPDDDHIGGLAGALNYAAAGKALSPVEEDDTETFQNFKKYLARQNISITIPKAGEAFSLGSASVTVLGPTEITDSDNNNSLVLKVEHGKSSFLFTGDAEKKEEADLLIADEDLTSTVLKVGHHGSAGSTGEEFLAAVGPTAAVISCGKDNEYGHPTAEVLERLKKKGIQVFRTDLQGDITFHESEGELVCEVSGDPDADVFVPGTSEEQTAQPQTLEKTNREGDSDSSEETDLSGDADPTEETDLSGDTDQPEETAVTRNNPDDKAAEKHEMDYVVNTNTGKFHYPDCRGVRQMKEKNKKYVTCERQDLLDRGYESCGICHP